MNSTDRDKATALVEKIYDRYPTAYRGEQERVAFIQAIATALAERQPDRPQGWQWTHEHNAELIKRDGLMCEQHLGLEFDHDGCAGPGTAWALEGREVITATLSEVRRKTWDAAIGIVDAAGEDWGDQARARESKTYSAYAIAALDIRGRLESAKEKCPEPNNDSTQATHSATGDVNA